VAELGPIVNGVGALFTAYGQYASGRAAKAEGALYARAAVLQANEMRRNAQQTIAAGAIQAREERRQAALLQSRALVLSVAGGGSASDPTIVNILTGIANEGDRRASIHMENAREDARGIRMQALATELGGQNVAEQGKVRASAYTAGAVSTLAKEGSSLYGKYKKGSKPAGDAGLVSASE
jgi:hypothetical protein